MESCAQGAISIKCGSITLKGPESGKNADPERETFLTSKDNEDKEITISFTGSDGEYDATYSIDEESNEDEPVTFSADGVIYVDVISSPRTSEEDITEAVISVLNASDVRVIVHVLNDPEPPDNRVRFSGNTQNVEVREEKHEPYDFGKRQKAAAHPSVCSHSGASVFPPDPEGHGKE